MSELESLNYDHPNCNMYGCFPCPKCGSRYRWPDQKGVIHCDDCGYESLVKEQPHDHEH